MRVCGLSGCTAKRATASVRPEPKFLVDECCLGVKAVHSLNEMLRFHPAGGSVIHLFTHFRSGVCDTEWIPWAASNGYMVISNDQGKNSRRGLKLTVICGQLGVSHAIFSGKLVHSNTNTKLLAIQHLWTELTEMRNAPTGSGFTIARNGIHAYQLKPRRLKTNSSEVTNAGSPDDPSASRDQGNTETNACAPK